MPRQAAVSIENNLTKGLITEATGLNFPENACTETYDCIFDRTGEVYRRYGIQLEDNFEVYNLDDITSSAITEFVWKTVALNGEITFLVIQIGSVVSFWEIDETGSASPNLKDFNVNLSSFKVAGAPEIKDINVSFASGNGQLYIAHPHCETIFVEYDFDTDTIETKAIDLKIRDISGVPNYKAGTELTTQIYMDADYRPSNSEFGHNQYYNLLNKGWGELRTVTWNRKFWGDTTPLAAWRHAAIEFVPGAMYLWMAGLINPAALVGLTNGRTDWPSDADQIELMKQPLYPYLDADGNIAGVPPPEEAWSVLGIKESLPGNTPSPRGKFLYNAYFIDRYSVLKDWNNHRNVLLSPGEISSIFTANGSQPMPIETSGYARPSQITFFAGRVWYAGIQAPKYNTRIYFSQIVESNRNYDKAYQNNDPGASEAPSNDLLATDGGIVVIPDIARIVKLLPMGSSLLVFATNGIWRISGANEGAGFSAINYTITKMSDFGAISALNFVQVDGAPLWWNSEGIYTIASTGQSSQVAVPTVQSITDPTIRRFFDEIPIANRRYAKGAFNKSSKIVQWLFRSTEATNVQERYQYDRILNIDTATGAIYPWTISDACLYVAGIVVLDGHGGVPFEEEVTDGGVLVTDAGDPVTDSVIVQSDLETRFKYLTLNECDNIDPGDEIDNGITVNPEFKGYLTESSFDRGGESSSGGIIYGEDGEIYTFAKHSGSTIVGGLGTAEFQCLTNPGLYITYDVEQYRTDLLNTSDALSVTHEIFYISGMHVIAVPYTAYFYAIVGYVTPYLEGCMMIGLYKINSSGNVEFMNKARAYSHGWGNVPPLSEVYPRAVGYKSYAQADPLDRTVVCVLTVSGVPPYVLELPSVNSFTTIPADLANLWSSLINTSITMDSVYFLSNLLASIEIKGDNGANASFFLPTASGYMLCKYVSKVLAQWHINTPTAGGSPTLYAFSNANPDGFVIGNSGSGWTLINNSFRDEDGNVLIPFADAGLDRDGTGSNGNNDWANPNHQYNEDNGVHYLMWARRFNPTVANSSPTGDWTKLLVQTWNPNSQIATFFDEKEANGYDTVDDTDFAEHSRYGSFSQTLFPLFNQDYDEIWFYGALWTGNRFLGYKFVDFVHEFTVPTSSLSFSEFTNQNYIDWPVSTIGYDYTSYFITGYKLRGEALRKFQSNYLQIYTRNEEESSFDVYGRWDYANSGNTGRWSSVQRVVQQDTNFAFATKRLKMRGHGKALQFKVSSVTEQPFNIIGFSMYETANAAP